jgi:Rrf2 family transcriptional regulator, iron-sulfur cluster assembly transcription factor
MRLSNKEAGVITKTGMHAVRAVTALARLPEGAYAGAARVAREIGAPQNYLGKLLQTLAHEGLLKSQKGLGGGFRLARDARRISMLDVLDPIERIGRWSGCIIGRPVCSDEHACAIHERWKKVRVAYLELLRRTSIADLVAKGEVEPLLA